MGNLVHCTVDRGVATITLDSQENRNALSRGLLADLHAALDRTEADDVRAVVLTHAGPSFCAGADLKERRDGPADSTPMVDAMRRLSDHRVPTIAAVTGAVRAGGIGLMASCDIVVVASATTFAFTEVRIGVAPAIISVPIVRRVTPTALAMPFLTGAPFDAHEARRIGLVDVATDDVRAVVDHLTEGVLLGAPRAVAETKALLRRVPTLGRDEAYDEMRVLSETLFSSADAQEGMRAFAERRAPAWQHDRSDPRP